VTTQSVIDALVARGVSVEEAFWYATVKYPTINERYFSKWSESDIFDDYCDCIAVEEAAVV